MEPKKKQVVGMLMQADKMIDEVYNLKGVPYGTALQANLCTAHAALASAIVHVDNNYIEMEDRS